MPILMGIPPLAIYVLFFLLLVRITFCADPRAHFCSNSGNFTSHSPYERNLNKLIGDLSIKTPPTGYGQSSVGQNRARTHGLSLCRGDVSSSDCKNCVTDAGREIRKRCPNNKAATIWYDACLLKYSNIDFFGTIDDGGTYQLVNSIKVSNPKLFNQKLKGLLGTLTERAYNVEAKMYAAGELELKGSQKLYGLVQCTRDLSPVDCKGCLDGLVSELPSCCNGYEGGSLFEGSCYLRYETYPFFNGA